MVKKNTSIELAVALIKRHGLYVVHISLCNVPSFIVSLIGVTFVKELTLDEAVSSIVYRFHSNLDLYPFVLMSALEEQTKQERSKNQ
jgi:hypothetical protein